VVGRGVPHEDAAAQARLTIQFHWNPDEYLALMRAELPDYERLQEELVAATQGADAQSILDLGTGTGETARRVLDAHPRAQLTGIDSSEPMLDVARSSLDRTRATLRLSRLEDPLPPGPFDLCISALAVHHLDGPGKADLFKRLGAVLTVGGRFVLADVVVPDDPADALTPLSPDYDLPSTVAEQLRWLGAAGFEAEVTWCHRDLAVLSGEWRS
jgi:tRNA (cmo5U34)-methyltransferase